jgi:hypothetical protein
MAREARGGGVVDALARMVSSKLLLTAITAELALAAPDITPANETVMTADIAANL